MSEYGEIRKATRQAIADALGPEVMRDALDTDEARSYIAAQKAADAELIRFAAVKAKQAQEIADDLSRMLPESLRFEFR